MLFHEIRHNNQTAASHVQIRQPVDIDEYRAGISAMRGAKVFAYGVRIFLCYIHQAFPSESTFPRKSGLPPRRRISAFNTIFSRISSQVLSLRMATCLSNSA